MSRLVIGTRGSKLALWQTRFVTAALQALHPGLTVEERIIQSEGDIQADVALASIGQTGVFVRTLERALEREEIDLAVHSLKDLPTEQPSSVVISTITRRHDARDAVVSVDGHRFDQLPSGSRVATSSPRRRCQLLHLRPDLRIVPVRGNIDTRIAKLRQGDFEALVLALAGLQRLGLDRDIGVQPIDPAICVPAAGQGALALEIRRGDEQTHELASALADPPTLAEVSAERAFLQRLGGGCLAPATAFAVVAGERILVTAVVGELDGDNLLLEHEAGPLWNASVIGARLAERLLIAGADRMLGEARRRATEEGTHR